MRVRCDSSTRCSPGPCWKGSGVLVPGSVPGRAVRKAVDEAQLLVSESTMQELAEVLARSELDPYVTIAERQEFLRVLGRIAEMVPIVYTVHACRNPRDDKFLDLAVNGEADLIVTGDQDLLVLQTFRDIPVITPARYLVRQAP